MSSGCRMELIEETLKLVEEEKKAANEIAAYSRNVREIDEIHQKFEQIYGGKYGKNRRAMSRRLEPVELDRMIRLVRAENSQPQKTGLFGFGGMKKEEYETFTDKLNLIRSNLSSMAGEWNAYLRGQQDAVKQKFAEYEGEIEEAQNLYRAAMDTSEPPFPEEVLGNEISLGKICRQLPECESIRVLAAEGVKSIQGNTLELLLQRRLDQPVPCSVFYEDMRHKEHLNAFLRNLIRQVMYQLPLYRYEIYYLDGMNNCSGLREMLELQNIQETYADLIVPQLAADGFRMLHVDRDSDGIHQELLSLEKYMGQVTDLLQGKPGFEQYNRENEQKIPYKIVILDSVDGNAEQALVRKLLINGPRCGIFVILLQDQSQMQKQLDSDNDKLRMAELSTLIEYGNDVAKVIPAGGQESYVIKLLEENRDYHDYIAKVLETGQTRKQLDNSFAACFPENYVYGQYTSTVELENGNLEGKIEIPFAIDRRGRMTSIELGSPNYAHGLISGATGSGKSTMLHMIINSVVMNYHPEDVEIWLVDYKKIEFSVYIEDRPPHVKFIGIERNEEFTFSLLDLITEEYERRLDVFRQENVRNIDLYKKKRGMHSMARILLIIDEFHLMSQQISENMEYSRKLENLLAEGRGAGIVCLFVDQAISQGLRGLTQKGKDQMRMRLAMANAREETAVTLDISSQTAADIALESGEALRKYIRKIQQPDGTERKEACLESLRVVYLLDDCRREIAHKALALYGEGRQALIVDGNKQAVYEEQVAKEYEQMRYDGRNIAYLHLGKPSNLEKCFAIPLVRNYGENILCILDKFDLQRRVFLSSLDSFLREENRKVYVLAEENDEFYHKMWETLQNRSRENTALEVYSDYGQICDAVRRLSEELVDRRSHQKKEEILIFWMGLESMLKEFSYYPAFREDDRRKETPQDDLEVRLEGKMAAFLGETKPKEKEKETELFNATSKIVELMTEGGKRGIHQFVLYSSIQSLKMAREIKTDNFKFKLSGFMNKDQCFEFYGTAKFMESIDEKAEDMLVCHDGNRGRFFLPYLVEE